MPDRENASTGAPDGAKDVVDQLEAALANWRSRIDQLIVQLDLATMDARDSLGQRLTAAENAGLAVRSGITYVAGDVVGGLSGSRDVVTKVLEDLRATVDSVKRTVGETGR